MKQLKKGWQYAAVIGIACAAFFYIYGFQVLNPTYTEWLLGKGDLSQHYLGWQAFRNGSWQFPLGLTDQLAWPESTSVIFTDSIPLFAVFFKIFRGILPTDFQYFGIWGLLCFILMGILSVRILNRFIHNSWYVIFMSAVFIVTPVMIFRMYSHTALAGHWLILEAIDIYLDRISDRTKAWRWAALGALAGSIHLYLLLMCGMILAGCCVQKWIEKRKIGTSVLFLGCYVLAAGTVIALLGGFSSGMSAQNAGLGAYSLNLNGFINPQGWSSLLPDLALYGTGQGEGFNYLGAGVLVMTSESLIGIICLEDLRNTLRNHKDYVISFCLIMLAALFFAMSDIITLNDIMIVNLPLPGIVRSLWSVFRATGRVAWIIVYFIMTLSAVFFYRTLRDARVQTAAGAAVLCLQVYDIHVPLEQRHLGMLTRSTFQTSFTTSDFWEKVSSLPMEHVILASHFSDYDANTAWSVADWALDNGYSLNDFYFARDNTETFSEYVVQALTSPENNQLFIFKENDFFTAKKYRLHYYEVDGVIAGLKEPLDGYQELLMDDMNEIVYRFGDNYVKNGSDHDGIRELYSSGLSYGPYWNLPEGTYHVTISGSGLQNCTITMQSLVMENFAYEIVNEQKTETVCSFDLAVSGDATAVEILIQNQAEENAVLEGITVSMQ